ncbi:MAG TPA: hypothetical protein VLT58_13290 [Polyangia bacterium]|nr:hypothetical protein [Polyangia bacterium]
MATAANAWGAPPVPSGAHPRLFINGNKLSVLSTAAKDPSTASGQIVKGCQDTVDDPTGNSVRGGADGGDWPLSAVACAFSWLTTKNMTHLTAALKYWKASLNDDQTIGDGLGCVAGADLNAAAKWNGSGAVPPAIITVSHDTGYPMRWYGPSIALVYDWLYSAPGVDSALLAQTRGCLTAWNDYYTASGYLNFQPGSNYNAGYVAAKALSAVAIGNDGGADGHLWTEAVDDVFGKMLVGKGLAGASGAIGTPAGVMVGGDWAEGWQYGPIAVLNYAAATVALEQGGAPQPEMDAWANSLAVRTAYATVPTNDGQWMGGDFDSGEVYVPPKKSELFAVLAGPSSDQAASWAAFNLKTQMPPDAAFIYDILGDTRSITPQDFRAQQPAPPLWYLARGTRAMYVRTGWDAHAFWGVFSSSPANVPDHIHLSASNFVFTRGADHLIVDPSPYGLASTQNTNAVTADSAQVTGDYATSQTFWSNADLPWARGSQSGVFAARSDFARAFDVKETPSDIPYAHREWVMFPEGEVVTIDRVQTGAASRVMYLNFHANTKGTLKLSGNTATGTVGKSKVVIHGVSLSGGTPAITQPPTADCSVPWGKCISVRFAVDDYNVKVPGPYAVAVHVIDGLASSDAAATVGSMNDDSVDPAPKQNSGVLGAAVYRSSKQSYVIASAAQQGASGTTMTYGVPGGSAGRHIVFDAPEDGSGMSVVKAAAQSGRCVLTITAGAGLAGHPLMFSVSSAADGCKVAEDLAVPDASVPPGGGVMATGTGATVGGNTGGGTGAGSTGGGAVSGDPTGAGSTGGGAIGGGATGGFMGTGEKLVGGCSCLVCSGTNRPLDWAGLAIAVALACFARYRRPSGR